MAPLPLDALDRAARLVGDRWSLLILGALLEDDLRYGELRALVPGISSNVLAQRLTALEQGGLVVAEPYSRRPLRMRYAATAEARELAGALTMLAAWGDRRSPESEGAALRHELCGTALQVRWHCPACDVDVPAPGDHADPLADPAIFLA
ncbi:MAG: transcriptional regulator, HxlR family [Conexibacter sp.]|jgi:DNA-binding HxlR family transcriptional regulator|nr:transcriptional regulator, HxlR family [Conexibacter sp.]